MYLDILHVFHTYPSNESKIHFTIHIRYIKILYMYLGRFLGVTLDTY
jgi:hypothetical protein